MATTFLLYGATGYTGNLIARQAVQDGLHPILAGRDAKAVAKLAHELGVAYRVVGLDAPAALDAALADVSLVLHCAGPFRHTARPMVDACLRTHTHYLDITGEIDVFEALAARTEEATRAHTMLLPGVGFDVVPSDGLAAYLKTCLPTATHLTLAFQGIVGISYGTLRTALEHVSDGGVIRRNGRLQRVPHGWKRRVLDLGRGPVRTTTIPWGDVSTAFYSTGIPNIEVYLPVSPFQYRALIAIRYLGWLLRVPPVPALLNWWLDHRPAGPTAAARARGVSVIWGEVQDQRGQRWAAHLQGPEPYTLTVHAALAIVRRVLAGQIIPGFQTPARAFGADLVFDIPGVVRSDLAADRSGTTGVALEIGGERPPPDETGLR